MKRPGAPGVGVADTNATPFHRWRRLLALLTLLVALSPSLALAFESADQVAEQRRIHGEPSLGRRLLALPYDVVALTGWPIKKTVIWMEDVNLPQRIEDAFSYPGRRLRPPEEER